jgi:hypothetical protein
MIFYIISIKMRNLICNCCGVGIYYGDCDCLFSSPQLKHAFAKEILKYEDTKSYRKISLFRKMLPIIRSKSPLSKMSVVFCY